MNIVIVTSQVTYVPGNYQMLLEEVFKHFENTPELSLKGVLSLKSIDRNIFSKIIGLPLLGVFDLAKNLLLNTASYSLGKRQKICQKYALPHLSFNSLNDQMAKSWLKEQKVDLILNIRTRCLYKNDLLEIPTLGCINIHHGLLPQYRGTFCDLYALYEGRSAGFSIHHMEKKVDAGVIYDVVEVSEGSEKNYEQYLLKAEKLEVASLKKLFSYLNDFKCLPEGRENTFHKPTYTKNPTPSLIKAMRLKGLKL